MKKDHINTRSKRVFKVESNNVLNSILQIFIRGET